jgi:hypothetical protein
LFEQTFRNIDDTLRKDAGCSSELDYVEQTSWILFLKYLDDFEKDRQTAAELAGKKYVNIISPEYRWRIWAAPKNGNGKIDFHKALAGDDLKDFVDLKLFPYLRKFKTEAKSPDTIEYKIGEIFTELKNKQKEFLEFVLSKYIESGVEELDQEKLPELLELKYQALEDAKDNLGSVENIRDTFIGFQKHLYAGVGV